MKRPGIIARQTAASLKGEQYAVDDQVRAARGFALQIFDLQRRQADAHQRVAKARDALERINVSALEVELAGALAEQADIQAELDRLKGPIMAG